VKTPIAHLKLSAAHALLELLELPNHSHSLKKLKLMPDVVDAIKDQLEEEPQVKMNKLYFIKIINNN